MKILLIEDHPLFLDGLSLLFAQEFPHAEVLQAQSLAEAEALLTGDAGIDWVLLDLGLPDSDGIAALERVHQLRPDVVCVVMSADERPGTILAALDRGAAGFLPKTTRHGELRRALQQMMNGGVYLPTTVLAAEPAGSTTPRPEAGSITALGLSPRQGDVLRLLIEGKPNKLICRDLGLSESTVKTHLAAIFRKLGASSRTQAVVAAARLGLQLPTPAAARSRQPLS